MKRAAIAFFAGLGLAVAPGALASDSSSSTTTTTVAPEAGEAATENSEVQNLLQKIGESATAQDMEDAQKALEQLDLQSLAEVVRPILEKASGEGGMLHGLLDQLKDPASLEEASRLLKDLGGENDPLGKLQEIAAEFAKITGKPEDDLL